SRVSLMPACRACSSCVAISCCCRKRFEYEVGLCRILSTFVEKNSSKYGVWDTRVNKDLLNSVCNCWGGGGLFSHGTDDASRLGTCLSPFCHLKRPIFTAMGSPSSLRRACKSDPVSKPSPSTQRQFPLGKPQSLNVSDPNLPL